MLDGPSRTRKGGVGWLDGGGSLGGVVGKTGQELTPRGSVRFIAFVCV